MNDAVMIVGCGYLGRRAARRWREQGRTVYALTRSNAEELRAAGIEPIVGDVLNADSLRHFPDVGTLLYAVGLDRTAGHSMRDVYVSGLQNVLAKTMSITRIIYVSSTSVYGQTDGSWVDESSPTEPFESSGKIVMEAEGALIRLRSDAVRLRFAGIYGPGRLLREQAILRGEPLGGDPEKWLNLIHVEDGAAACVAAEKSTESLINIADDCPMTRCEFYTLLAGKLNAPPPRFDGSPSGRETHRRISNRLMKTVLPVSLAYPNAHAGLSAAVAVPARAGDDTASGSSPP
jgi:nucleoside-diphosphate-sugar epimerase